MSTTAAKAALPGTLDAVKNAIPHVIAHILTTTIAKRRKKVDKGVTGSLEPQLKKTPADTGVIDINALIDGSGIVLDLQNDWRIFFFCIIMNPVKKLG